MEKIDRLFGRLAKPFFNHAHWLIRLGLGISFFLHGYGKIPISEDFIGWLSSNLEWGVIAPQVIAPLLAWGEVLAGLGIILGGILALFNLDKFHPTLETLGNVITRLSGGAIGVIMISAIYVAHSDWAWFVGERGQVLLTSEQIFLLLLGIFFAIRGNKV